MVGHLAFHVASDSPSSAYCGQSFDTSCAKKGHMVECKAHKGCWSMPGLACTRCVREAKTDERKRKAKQDAEREAAEKKKREEEEKRKMEERVRKEEADAKRREENRKLKESLKETDSNGSTSSN